MEITKLKGDNKATVPAGIRSALGLTPGDTIGWEVSNDEGEAIVCNARSANRVWMNLSEESFAKDWLSPQDEKAWRDL